MGKIPLVTNVCMCRAEQRLMTQRLQQQKGGMSRFHKQEAGKGLVPEEQRILSDCCVHPLRRSYDSVLS